MIKEKGFQIIFSSDFWHEKLCAEIYYDREFVAVITQDKGIENAVIEIFPPQQKPEWTFSYSEFHQILDEAYNSLKS